jgi:hypothetical protein
MIMYTYKYTLACIHTRITQTDFCVGKYINEVNYFICQRVEIEVNIAHFMCKHCTFKIVCTDYVSMYLYCSYFLNYKISLVKSTVGKKISLLNIIIALIS